MTARAARRTRAITWAGRLIVFYGAAHTIGALAVEGAATHAGTWFSGGMWGEGFVEMSPAMSAYWLSVNSFGPPLVLLGETVLWLDRRGITPPPFLAWPIAGWVALGTAVVGPAPQDLILLTAAGLLWVGTRRGLAAREDGPALSESGGRPVSRSADRGSR